MDYGFKVEKIGPITKITNNIDLNLWIYNCPKPPKRTFTEIIVIRPGEFWFCEFDLDLTRVSFRLLP